MAEASDFLDENGKWMCTRCGACCLLGPTVFPENELAAWDRGDGGCKHLNSRKKCRIYATRPKICRTRVNSPGRAELEYAEACAFLKNLIDREIELGLRSPVARQWRLKLCPSGTTPKEGPATS